MTTAEQIAFIAQDDPAAFKLWLVEFLTTLADQQGEHDIREAVNIVAGARA